MGENGLIFAACVAEDIKPFFTIEANKLKLLKLKQYNTDGPNSGPTEKRDNSKRAAVQAAKSVGASRDKTNYAAKLKKESPELFEQVKQGKIKIKDAKNIIYKKKEAFIEADSPREDTTLGRYLINLPLIK